MWKVSARSFTWVRHREQCEICIALGLVHLLRGGHAGDTGGQRHSEIQTSGKTQIHQSDFTLASTKSDKDAINVCSAFATLKFLQLMKRH